MGIGRDRMIGNRTLFSKVSGQRVLFMTSGSMKQDLQYYTGEQPVDWLH